MVYKVLRIDEDLDFGCEERLPDQPVMVIVTLLDEKGEKMVIRHEDGLLYERNVNEGDLAAFDSDGKLVKVE